MTIKLNPEAVQYSLQLIGEGKYRINSIWRDNQPTPKASANYMAAHGFNELSKWYLATNTNADVPDGTPETLVFPVGDFANVHQTGLLAAKDRAALDGQEDIVASIDEILELFDRMNAC